MKKFDGVAGVFGLFDWSEAEMIALAFFAGIFLTAAVAILIVRGAKAPPCPGAKVYEVPGRTQDFRALFGPMVLDDDRMRSLSVRKPERDADFWDIANREQEPGRVEYRFLDIPYDVGD